MTLTWCAVSKAASRRNGVRCPMPELERRAKSREGLSSLESAILVQNLAWLGKLLWIIRGIFLIILKCERALVRSGSESILATSIHYFPPLIFPFFSMKGAFMTSFIEFASL